MYRYPVKLTPDDNGTLKVSFPDVPEALTFGESREDALRRGRDALESALSIYISEKQLIPRPSAVRASQASVAVSPLAAAKLALYEELQRRGMTKAQLGRALKLHPPQVERLLDLNHESRFDVVEDALLAVGKRLEVSLREAA